MVKKTFDYKILNSCMLYMNCWFLGLIYNQFLVALMWVIAACTSL